MSTRVPRLVLVGLVATAGCGALDTLKDPLPTPDIPDDFPQLDGMLDGRADLVVDGEMVSTKEGGSTYYDPGGIEPKPLPTWMSFDYQLELEWLVPEEGTYEASAGELTASYGDFEANGECGSGTLVIVGKDHVGGVLDTDAIWGTMQLELCEYDLDEVLPGRKQISGRFSSVVTEL